MEADLTSRRRDGSSGWEDFTRQDMDRRPTFEHLGTAGLRPSCRAATRSSLGLWDSWNGAAADGTSQAGEYSRVDH